MIIIRILISSIHIPSIHSGVLSTILLYMVDVKKSRQECEAFVAAEANRAAFSDSHFDDRETA